jgi:hypothetical protein
VNTLRRSKAIGFLGLVAFLLGACGGGSAGRTYVWIDVPRDGLSLPDVQAIKIEGHAASFGGVENVEILINGATEFTISDPPAEGVLANFHTEWTPSEPGEYTIQAVAYSAGGEASEPDTARVTFGGLEEEASYCAADELVAPRLASPEDGAAVEPEVLLAWLYPESTCHFQGFAIDIAEDDSFSDIRWTFVTSDHLETSSSGTFPAGLCYYWRVRAYTTDDDGPNSNVWSFCVEGPPTEVPSVTPGSVIQFWAEPPEIQAGGCTTIHWHVENVQSVAFGGLDQPFDGSYQDCMCESQRYTLTVTHLDNTEERRTLDIEVSGSCPEPEQDTTPPPAPTPAVPGNGLTLSCRSSQDLAWVPVDDPSGIAEYQVQVQRHSGDNNWQDVPGSIFGGIAGKQTSISVECAWYYRWRVRAVDGEGNVGPWSGWWQFTITLM